MSNEPVKHRCPPTCPKVREQLRAALAEAPWLADGIFPRKKNDVGIQRPPDVSRDVQDQVELVTEAIDVRKVPIHDEKIKIDALPKAVEDVIETKPVQEEEIVQPVSLIEKLKDQDFEKIELIKEKQLIRPVEKVVVDHDVKKLDLIEEEELMRETVDLVKEDELIQEITDVLERPAEKRVDDDIEKIDLIEERDELIQEPVLVEKIDREKIDLVEDSEFIQEPIDEQPFITIEKLPDRDARKIDLDEEEILIPAESVMEPTEKVSVTTEKPRIVEDEVVEPKKRVEDYEIKREEEEALSDYERVIHEEMEESVSAVTAEEIPEEPQMVRRKMPETAAVLREEVDRERPIELPKEREAREITIEPSAREEAREDVISPRAERVAPSKRTKLEAVDDACDETCPLVKEQKGEQLAYFQEETSILFVSRKRIMRKLKERQRLVDHYYLTKGFGYFEDVCTCSLACMVYSLSRDPFVRSIFASLTLFAVGLKLCSELDAWEMPSRVS